MDSQLELIHEWPGALKPYVHQVTGRSHILSVDSRTLCKSLLPRELLFYRSLPDSLRPLTPNLKGVLYAQLDGSETDGNHNFLTKQVFLKETPQVEQVTCHISIENGNNVEHHPADAYENVLFKGLERFKYDKASGFKSHPWTIDKDAEAVVEYLGANPWGVRQHRREINRMLMLNGATPDLKRVQPPMDADGNELQDKSLKSLRGYLMLEDVSAGFRHPNVIDFKLGRQIERDDCSQEKKDKHRELAKNSSTGTLMLRIAGMQVYQVNTSHYTCRDKYYGRGLSASGFINAIGQFFNNGEEMLVEVIPPIVKELLRLRSVLEKQDTFRFYASSLLLLYEGDDCRYKACQNAACEQNGTPKKRNSHSKSEACSGPRKIVVKMIDFAHSTYHGFNGDKTLHEGPDGDCLEGITNLIRILEDIAKHPQGTSSEKRECAKEIE